MVVGMVMRSCYPSVRSSGSRGGGSDVVFLDLGFRSLEGHGLKHKGKYSLRSVWRFLKGPERSYMVAHKVKSVFFAFEGGGEIEIDRW